MAEEKTWQQVITITKDEIEEDCEDEI